MSGDCRQGGGRPSALARHDFPPSSRSSFSLTFFFRMGRARRIAKREFGLSSVEDAFTGMVTMIQRFDSALRLNVHFHTLVLDGVYVRGENG